ncbi:MAG: diguanylate cyclase [Armatimonadetes bacterium]|nr:diguanylate cyclase [Armatimonadota bacterium]
MERVLHSGILPDDSGRARSEKAALTAYALIMVGAALLWGFAYWALGRPVSATIPAGYSFFSALSLLYFFRTKRYGVFRFTQLLFLLCLPCFVQWSLGGFAHSGVVLIWAILCPLGSLMLGGAVGKSSVFWLGAYLVLIAVSAYLDSLLSGLIPPFPHLITVLFFALNIAAVSSVVFVLLRYYLSENQDIMGVIDEKNRMLDERAQSLVEEKERTERALTEAERLRREAEMQRKAAEEARATVEEQSRQLLELDRIKTRFFSNMSHEFRTPLTLIIGPLEHLLSQAHQKLDAEQSRQFEVMLRNSRRLLRLINQLLDISKIEAGKMELRARETNVVEFLRAITLSFVPYAERKGISVEFCSNWEELPLFLDAEKMEKILYNLLSNALKFTPEKGRVSVSLGSCDGQSSNDVEVAVKDTGRGIPPNQIPHLFDRFFQVDGSATREQEGTGIGLSLVKDLVEVHHGSIRVESEYPGGTEFIIRLPRGREHLSESEIVEALEQESYGSQPLLEMASVEGRLSPAPPSQESREEAARKPGMECVLVVDDNSDVRQYVRVCLQDTLWVEEATNGLEGVDRARELKPDLVVSDVMMPKLDGHELCRILKGDTQFAQMPIILLTARASEEMKVAGLKIGADDYLSKPFSSGELKARVENLLKIRRHELRLRQFNDTLAKLNQKLQDQSALLKKQAITDGWTGLFNRRHLEARLAEELAEAKRTGAPLTVMMADADFFKKINDQFSHQAGDQVLQAIAQILMKNVCHSDIAARYGGEEFVVVLPGVTLETGVTFSEKIRKLVESSNWSSIHPDLKVTISLGVSSNTDVPHHDQLLALADEKLYQSKREGRNRVSY